MSANCGSGRSDGGFASPVQHPQELRRTVAVAAEAIVRIRSAFIECYRFRSAYCLPYT